MFAVVLYSLDTGHAVLLMSFVHPLALVVEKSS